MEELKGMGFDQVKIDEMLETALVEKREYKLSNADVFKQVTENNAVFGEKQLKETFINAAVGIYSVDEIETKFKVLLQDKELVQLYKKHASKAEVVSVYSTRGMIDLEKQMIVDAGKLNTRATHEVDLALLDKHRQNFEQKNGFQITSDQSAAIMAAATKGDLVILEGHAGTGKTTAIEVFSSAAKESGYNVRGAAPSGKAAAELGKIGIQADTLAALLLKNEGWVDDKGKVHEASAPITKNDIIVLDESGMVGSRDMQKLVKAVNDAGAKLVLMGDTRQLQAVGAGGAFRVLQEKFGVDASLISVQRQKNSEIKAVVASSRVGDMAKSLDILLEKGNLQLLENKVESYEAVARAWQRHYRHNSAKASESSIMLCNTNVDAEVLNGIAREYLKKTGLLVGGGAGLTEVTDRTALILGQKNF